MPRGRSSAVTQLTLPRDVSAALRLLNMTEERMCHSEYFFTIIPSEAEEKESGAKNQKNAVNRHIRRFLFLNALQNTQKTRKCVHIKSQRSAVGGVSFLAFLPHVTCNLYRRGVVLYLRLNCFIKYENESYPTADEISRAV